MFQVFKHLTELRKALERVRNLLEPDGRYIISFPNISGAQAKIFGPKWLHLDPPRHLFLMPEDAFLKAVHELGFCVERRGDFSMESVHGYIQSALNAVIKEPNVLYERFKGNQNYAPAHGKISSAWQLAAGAALFFPALIMAVIDSVRRRGATVEYVLRTTTGPDQAPRT